jgi:hypothetical protein
MGTKHSQPGKAYEKFIDGSNEADTNMDINSIRKSAPRSILYIIVCLYVMFCMYIVAGGIHCGLSPECKLSPEDIIEYNHTRESNMFMVSAMNDMVGVHLVTTSAIYQMARSTTAGAPIIMCFAALLFYIAVFVNYTVQLWFVNLLPIVFNGIWAICVMFSLRSFYGRDRKGCSYVFNAIVLSMYCIFTLLYAVFNSVPQIEFAQKGQAIFGMEVCLVAMGALFLLFLIFHIKNVQYQMRVVQ